MMKKKLLITSLLAFALGCFAAPHSFASDADKEDKQPRSSKKSLKRENVTLKSENDSLKLMMDSLMVKLEELDSLYAEIFEEDTIVPEDNIVGAERLSVHLQPEEYTQEITDSLITLWYAQQLVSVNDFNSSKGGKKFKSDVSDEVYIERLKKMNSFITIAYNDIVREHIIRYSSKSPRTMGHVLGIGSYYMPIFQEIFIKHGIPQELKAMAVIESALNPTAVSPAGAKGTWQFMYGTAKHYGLHIDSFVDERLDPIKSAEAAAEYLKDSYEMFGDWNLAIASYNCGPGNVSKAIKRAGSREFWDIWPYLPTETRGYVPAFVGALYAMEYHKEHGIKPTEIAKLEPIDTLVINKQLHLKQVSEILNIPMDELRGLNPQYYQDIVPGHERQYILRIPYKYSSDFIEKQDTIFKHKADELFNPLTIKKVTDPAKTTPSKITYVVKKGDSLGKIATEYKVGVDDIKEWNKLDDSTITVGQKLIIHTKEKPKAAKKDTKKIYTVKSGDTLGQIAEDHGVKVAKIKEWNKLDSDVINIGQKLTIYTDGKGPSSKGSSSSKSSSGSKYTVKSGDTLGHIAENHGVRVAQIKEWNNLKDDNITVGQTLIIKGGTKPSSSKSSSSASKPKSTEKVKSHITYTVKDGDSLYSIAKNYSGVSAQNIMDYNGMTNANIRPGMVIKIPQY